MQKANLKILQRFRLRPKQNGKLPNFTKDFQSYTDRINQVIKNKVEWSLQFNKYGIEKRRKNSGLKIVTTVPSRVFRTQYEEQRNCQTDKFQQGCLRLLKYNQTRINPDRKLKIRRKTSQKHRKQKSQSPIILEPIEFNKIKSSVDHDILPKINLSVREAHTNGTKRSNKENMALDESKTVRVRHYEPLERYKCYNKIHHIVTMGRKQVLQQKS